MVGKGEAVDKGVKVGGDVPDEGLPRVALAHTPTSMWDTYRISNADIRAAAALSPSRPVPYTFLRQNLGALRLHLHPQTIPHCVGHLEDAMGAGEALGQPHGHLPSPRPVPGAVAARGAPFTSHRCRVPDWDPW
jgi:hypothetical protein